MSELLENEPCRCDSRKAKINKAKVDRLEVIAQIIDNKPYYELKYRQVGKKDYSIGYSSYDLKIVLGYIDEYFEIVKSDKQTNADRIRNMSDEELAEFLKEVSENCLAEYYPCRNENCNGGDCFKEDILEWLQSSVNEAADT